MKDSKKKNLIIAAIIAVILVIVLVVWLMKGSNPTIGNNVIITEPPKPTISIGENMITNTPTVKPSIEPTVEATATPSPIPTIGIAPEVTVEPTETPVPTATNTPVPTATPVPTVTNTPVPTATPKPTETPVPTVTNTPVPTATSTPVPTATPKPTETPVPTATPSPTPTATPKPTATPVPTVVPTKAPVENDGSMVTWSDSTIKLDKIGTSLKVLDEFNDKGLMEDNAWFGDPNSPSYDEDKVLETLEQLDTIQEALIDKNIISIAANGFTLSNSDLTWHYSSWSATGDFELNKNKSSGYYEIVINRSLKEDIVYGKDVAGYNREILIAMLSMISSTPKELFDYMYKGMYEDSSILTEKSFTKVGDASVRWNVKETWIKDGGKSLHVVFEVKPQ